MKPQIRFSRFTEEWQAKSFGNLGKVAMCRRIFSSETNSTSGVPFYKIGTFGKKPDAYIPQEQYEEYKRKYSFPRVGDILLSASGTIGRMVVYDGKPAYFQDSNIIWLSHDDTEVINAFLRQIYPQINWIIESGTIQRLYNDNFLKMKITIPSTREQEKIAEFLTVVDERIGKAEKKLELLQQYKKGVMQKIFSQQIRFKDEKGGAYPEWEEKRLGELVNFHRGNLLSKSDIVADGKYECVHYGELFTDYDEVIESVRSKTNLDTGSTSKKGDILMPTSDVTPQGLARASAIQTSGVMLGGDINILRPKSGIDSVFLSYLINLEKKKIMRLVTGTTVRHIYSKDISKILYMIPASFKEQQKIATFLNVLDDKIKTEQTRLTCAKQWKKGLLQRMFV